MQQQTITKGEILASFHFLRKSACNLSEDLRYFTSYASHFNDQQTINILGQLSDIENNIKKLRTIINNTHEEKTKI